MRKIAVAFLAAALLSACDPTIKKFEVVPDKLQCPGKVTLTWEGDADGGRIQADQPVTPALPPTVLKTGSMQETVSATTTFTYFFPSAAHREKTVTVAAGNCGGPGPGGNCGPQVLTFSGQCFSAQSGPQYNTQNVNVAVAPGALVNLMSDGASPCTCSTPVRTSPSAPPADRSGRCRPFPRRAITRSPCRARSDNWSARAPGRRAARPTRRSCTSP